MTDSLPRINKTLRKRGPDQQRSFRLSLPFDFSSFASHCETRDHFLTSILVSSTVETVRSNADRPLPAILAGFLTLPQERRFDSRSRAVPIGSPSASIIYRSTRRTRQRHATAVVKMVQHDPYTSTAISRECNNIENEESRGEVEDGERRHRGWRTTSEEGPHEVSAFERKNRRGEWSCTSVASVEKRSRERNDRRGDGRVVSIRGRGKPARQSR